MKKVTIIMRLMGLAGTEVNTTPFDGQWLEDFGSHVDGHIKTTVNPKKAKRFHGIEEAMRYWRQQHGIRSTDGEPNRPLTAFTVEFRLLQDIA
jgi:hypothetical protein